MQLLYYIQVKPVERINFGNPYNSLLSEIPKLMLLDADNHSADFVIQQQIKLLEKAENVVLVLDVMPDAAPRKLVGLMEKFMRSKQLSPLIFLNGSNELIEKMLRLAHTEFHTNLKQEEIVSSALAVFTSR
jgi:hypothetical protein